MAYYFDEAYYVVQKLSQLQTINEKDPVTGDFYTETGLHRAFAAAGMTPQEHYERYGRLEGLNPNQHFNEDEYLWGKLWQLQSTEPQNNWTLEKLNAALEAAHLTPVEHYERYGCYEKDAGGNFIRLDYSFNPYYYENKLYLCQESGETVNGKTGDAITLDDVVSAFQAANLSPISHYVLYGKDEGLPDYWDWCGTGKLPFPEDPGLLVFEDASPYFDVDTAVKLVGVDIAENEYGALATEDFSGA